MQSTRLSDKKEQLLSPRLVVAALAAAAVIIYLAVETLPIDWRYAGQVRWFVVVVGFLAGVGWVMVGRRPLAARWFTLGVLSVVAHLGGLWVHRPGMLLWAVVPVAFAAPLVGLPGAAVAPVVESVLIIALPRVAGLALDPSASGAVLVAVWSVFGAAYAIEWSTQARLRWMSEQTERARRSLDEVRSDRAASEQAVVDLAHANRQLLLMNERVSALRLLAEEAQKAKSSFVARVSHEFRTPLNMIIGLVELMVETPEIYDVAPSPRMEEALQVVYRNSQHLSQMVNDVLDLTQAEADRVVLHRERVSLREVIESAAEAVGPLLESKALTLSVVEAEPTPPVYCDRTRIEQVVLNLLSNAARYTDEGGITVSLSPSGQFARVRVTDTGPGIAPQDLERIFEPFHQAGSPSGRHSGGSGLGLTISQQLVRLHEGRLWVESTVGVGSTFSFELPISAPLAPLASPGHQVVEDWVWRQRTSPRPSLPEGQRRPRFVVCDDRGDLQDLLSRYSDQIEFVCTQGCTEVRQVLQQAPAHAILLNVSAPVLPHPAIETLRGECPGTPIVACSVPSSLERVRTIGLLGQLIKPVTRAALATALRFREEPVRRVLVVDDNPDAAELFRQMLRACDESVETEVVHSGAEALDCLRREPPDLMLLDLVMPGIDGWQVLDTMTRDDGIPPVATYLVSAQDPADRPPRSGFLLATWEDGFSVNQLLRSTWELSSLLLQPDSPFDAGLSGGASPDSTGPDRIGSDRAP